MPKNAIVLGMARSGTSLTASIFARHGYHASLENDLVEGDHYNPTGYFEAESLLKENENLLKATGFGFDNTWIYDEIDEQQIKKLENIELDDRQLELIKRFEDLKPWVWKDPRLCYTLANWWPHLDQDNTAALLILRDKEAIFDSFVRVGWRYNTRAARDRTYHRIEQHIDSSRRLLKKLNVPYAEINYADYKKNPAFIVKTIEELFGLSLDGLDTGYNEKFDHNSMLGKVSTRLDKLAELIPDKPRKLLKSIIPRRILKMLFPERFN